MGQSGGVFPQLMRHQASDDDKLMAEHQDASTTVLIDSLWCVGIMMYAAAQASMLRTCTAWRGGMPFAPAAARRAVPLLAAESDDGGGKRNPVRARASVTR
jgi:hypothetical protein